MSGGGEFACRTLDVPVLKCFLLNAAITLPRAHINRVLEPRIAHDAAHLGDIAQFGDKVVMVAVVHDVAFVKAG